ncbi:FecCD family ABC transporter permease [Microbacterium amylolyticum]|uniref:Iron complex transport system permease protein n=1 Tax=Microbacterium amylolyticum TaxID=936337 RepID=A0ABS4ZDV0_9MICO|nr:iron chelate uptake ABC transporter family permease subunit [Microbacterium amylolyticum]MBP2435455.1 iron complex transport system permease protein [Microbacterium amylolyticum]
MSAVQGLSVATRAIRETRSRTARHRRRTIGALTVITVALFFAALSIGDTVYGADVVLAVLRGDDVPGASYAIGERRLPRALIAVLAGASFGIAGTTFQTMLRNPLASPDVIGITSGAGAAAVACIVVFGFSGTVAMTTALIAGLITALAITLLARGGPATGARLILIGIGVGALLDAVVQYLLLRADQWNVPAALRWLSGSLNQSSWSALWPLLIAVAALLPLALVLGRSLRPLELGDDTASALGIRLQPTRLALILCAVGLVSFATATTGPIAFVAFLSGPIARGLTGRAGSPMIPAALVGACLVLAADLVGQHALPVTYPVGVVTGVVGAPYLLILLTRMNRTRS